MDLTVLTIVVVMAVLGIASAVFGRKNVRTRARVLLSITEGKSLKEADDGQMVRALGMALRADRSLNAPFTGRSCFAYRATVELWDDREDGAASSVTVASWREVLSREDGVAFALVSDGVEARVEGPFVIGLEVGVTSEDEGDVPRHVLETFDRLNGASLNDVYGRGRRLRFCEAVLEHGDEVWVLGRASVTVDPNGRRDSARAQPVTRAIRGTEREPVVLADEDRPGVLDRFGD